MRRFLALTALTASVAFVDPTMAEEKKLRVFEGEWTPVEAAEFATTPLKPEGYTESWYAMVQAPDDLWIFLHFGLSNLEPMSDFDGAVETTVLYQGKDHFVKTKTGRGNVKHDEGKLDLTIGKNSIKAVDGAWKIALNQEGDDDKIKLDLTLTPVVAAIKPGKTIYPDGEFYKVDFIPRARAEGKLVLNGKTIPVSGPAYADHSLQDYPAHKMAERLYSFRGYAGEYGVSFLDFHTPKHLGKVRMPTLVLSKGDEVVARTTNVQMAGDKIIEDDDNDYTYPTEWTFEALDGERKITGKISLGKQVQKQNATDDFNFFERALIKTFVANPVIYRHVGDFSFAVDGTSTTMAGKGIAEVVILDE